MRNTLICTVGTSLFESNLKNLSENYPNKPSNWRELRESYEKREWRSLAKELIKIDPTHRVCGAEINTIESLRRKKKMDIQYLFFLVSDTEDGRNTGIVLENYFNEKKELNLRTVEYREIEKLQDPDPNKFKTEGLRNLVKIIGEYVTKFRAENCAIDATGGYKAQIAVAVLIGQALDIPVYYKHERFNEIIDFPPLPISLDYDLLGRNASLLTYLEKGEIVKLSQLENFDDKLRVFLNEVECDGEEIFELNAIGQLYLTSFRLRYPYSKRLREAADNERKEPTFPQHHYPIGFKEFVKKIWLENRWITTCQTLPYNNQRALQEIEFFVREENNKSMLIGTYRDSDKFGARYQIILTDFSKESLNWAAEYLNRHYSGV